MTGSSVETFHDFSEHLGPQLNHRMVDLGGFEHF